MTLVSSRSSQRLASSHRPVLKSLTAQLRRSRLRSNGTRITELSNTKSKLTRSNARLPRRRSSIRIALRLQPRKSLALVVAVVAVEAATAVAEEVLQVEDVAAEA